jgi:hypothetical protein
MKTSPRSENFYGRETQEKTNRRKADGHPPQLLSTFHAACC